ncbi:MAG TPA: ABC transporter permease [Gaiellaceae bacterium]|nr:ABC transporter permease [Gaiellaceae bacterium]
MSATQTTFALGISLMAPILWAALGELIVEQSGVLNIGIEGVMLIGAFVSAIGYHFVGSLYVGLLAAIGSGLACGLVLSILYVRLGTDQIVTGILFNVFALGFTTTLYTKYLGGGVSNAFGNLHIPGLSSIPWLGPILFDQNFLVYAAILAAPLVYYLVHRTWFGLYARAAAENPRAVESAGLDVWRLRYPAVVLGCMLTAVGGATIVLSTSGGFVAGLTSGRGYIALAVVVLARWNPYGAVLGSVLFGVAEALQFQVQNLGFLSKIPSDFVLMFPYIVTVVAVVFALGSRYPAACGIPFRPSAKSA